MFKDQAKILWDDSVGGVVLKMPGNAEKTLHPLWLRERANGADAIDPLNNQRLYDPTKLPDDLRVSSIDATQSENLIVRFSDNYTAEIPLERILVDCGAVADRQSPPAPEPWRSDLAPRPEFDWSDLDDRENSRRAIAEFFRLGFCIFRNTPTQKDSLKDLASRFGYLRETNFGLLFNVVKKERANDLAYTTSALSAHTDNPYRVPMPGIQFLHCLENTVAGGLSTLVDGFAIVDQLTRELPEAAALLTRTPVRFRYEAPGGVVVQNHAPIIERGLSGELKCVRLSTRLDFAPLLEPGDLDLFYAGRARLQALAASEDFEIRYTFEPGVLLMMDNYRTMHGRTAFDGTAGKRFLQGCYIDHDGPDALYRMLARDGKATLGRDEY